MAGDFTTPVRRAVLIHMKADTDLVGIVPASRQYPQTTPAGPTWPFTRYGVPISTPLRAACVDASTISFVVHSFAKDRYSGKRKVESAEDYAARVAAAVKHALDRAKLELDGGGTAKIRWTSTQVMQDGDEAGAYHAVSSFMARVIG